MSTPTRPLNISSTRPSPRDGAGVAAGSPSVAAGSGTPAHFSYSSTPPVPNIPARYTPITVSREGTPSGSLAPTSNFHPLPRRSSYGGISAQRPGGTPVSGGGSDATPNSADLEDGKARVLKRHLLLKQERQNKGEAALDQDALSQDGQLSTGSMTPQHPRREDTEAFPIPYEAPGADVVHDIYKWHTDQRRQAARPRAASFAGSVSTNPHPAFEHIHEPGGFRRNYVLLRADEQGTQPRVLNNFIDFLYIFGHFAGEDLEEEEDRSDEEEVHYQPSPPEQEVSTDETQPLLKKPVRSKSLSRKRTSVGPHGDASVTQAVMMLLKAFIGTGVLFLGKAFANGGLIFSVITISVVALISLYSFLLLVKTKFVVSGSFGDIGGALYGPWMRYAILASIAVSQIGFVCAYTIFVAENLQAFVLAVTKCATHIAVPYLIFIQLIVFIPLSMVRNLAKLSIAILIADAFILLGLIYIFSSEFSIIAKNGMADIQMFNPKDFPLFVGTAVFSFEGIGLVIPITDAMKEPRKFPGVLSGVMISLLFLFGGAGALSYLTFGSDVQAVVLVNLDQDSRLTQIVQFIYSLAILLSIPLQFFPAVRILENGLFTRSGKSDFRVKWTKNAFRAALVVFSAVISSVGAGDLDKFVSFIGSFACVPLCLVYPAMLHYKACAKTRREKLADIALGVFGLVAAAYTTVQTVQLMLEPEEGGSPNRCATP